ncbi:Protein-lysine N-methyltransferase efm4 [Diatrype stigma]|uniref:Protein-lysine N-methyltransferase EFM4 n=1 Tax=Diatrype stigma TaxID=117547 RepID=A0AAN9UIG8_9PEZI
MTITTAERDNGGSGVGVSPSNANHNGKLTHLEPSELGTKEYWDELYDREIQNHAHDPSDTGTVWFDDSDAEARVVAFLCDHHAELLLTPPPPPPQEKDDDDNDDGSGGAISFLDLGTGNGSLLFGLRDAADAGDLPAGRMLGVDYSPRSVEFARRIAAARSRGRGKEKEEGGEEKRVTEEEGKGEKKEGEGEGEVEFQLHDILHDPPTRLLSGKQARGSGGKGGGWDVVLDKGTFDAVSLSSEEIPVTITVANTTTTTAAAAPRTRTKMMRICEAYPRRVLPLVRAGGLLVVTSCNWTEEELRRWFVDFGTGGGGDSAAAAAEVAGERGAGAEGGGDRDLDAEVVVVGEEEDEAEQWRFEQVGRVEYPSFSFGGVKGQTISTLCFRKVRR